MNFHDEVERYFQNQIERMDQKLKDDSSLTEQKTSDLNARRNEYVNKFEPYLRINTFLMMVSHLEEWLYHIWKRWAPDTELFEAKGSIGRFKPVLREIGVDLSRSGSWMFLKGCQDIRSCLLHANGRVSLHRNPQKIRKFVDQYNDSICIESDQLVLKPEFLSCFRGAVEQLVESVSSTGAAD